jgi:hypothetical protein
LEHRPLVLAPPLEGVATRTSLDHSSPNPSPPAVETGVSLGHEYLDLPLVALPSRYRNSSHRIDLVPSQSTKAEQKMAAMGMPHDAL